MPNRKNIGNMARITKKTTDVSPSSHTGNTARMTKKTTDVPPSSRQNTLKSTKSQTLVLFPVHLFTTDVIKQALPDLAKYNVVLYEHPIYYGVHEARPMKFNKLKLAYVRATCLYYLNYLKKQGIRAEFWDIDSHTPAWRQHNSKTEYTCFDPVDKIISQELKAKDCKIIETPGFLLSSTDLEEYWQSSSHTRFYHSSFYNWIRKKLNVLPGSKTYDTQNRGKLPPTVVVPVLGRVSETRENWWKTAGDYVNGSERWKNCPGEVSDAPGFPLTHAGSVAWLDRFIDERFPSFGKYQDSIVEGRNFLFHSCISPMLNVGLLTPRQVLDRVMTRHKRVPIASLEGFVRQLIGWREYQRYIYIYAGDRMRSMNHFGNSRRLTAHWYNGTLGIKPVDDAIQMAFRDGYLHHILRLMVVGNFMNLCGIHPDDVYCWFMEFSLDSYDWVMVGNVYSMAMWADGGLSMRKPYISSSAYILSMSDYKSENWAEIWDSLFHHFIDRNQAKLKRTYYAGIVKAWTGKPISIRKKELQVATGFINKFTA